MKKRINITIEDHVLNKIDSMAKERGIDRSTMISILAFDSYQLLDLKKSGDDVSNSAINTFGEI